MELPERLQAEIVPENGLLQVDRYTRVEMMDGDFTIEPYEGLSVRRNQVLVLGSLGVGAAECAEMLDISQRTVNQYRSHILQCMFNAKNMMDATVKCFDPQYRIYQPGKPAVLPSDVEESMIEIISPLSQGYSFAQVRTQLNAQSRSRRIAKNDLENEIYRVKAALGQRGSWGLAGVVTLGYMARLLPVGD